MQYVCIVHYLTSAAVKLCFTFSKQIYANLRKGALTATLGVFTISKGFSVFQRESDPSKSRTRNSCALCPRKSRDLTAAAIAVAGGLRQMSKQGIAHRPMTVDRVMKNGFGPDITDVRFIHFQDTNDYPSNSWASY